MAQYDGSIRINTKIDTSGLEKGIRELEKLLENLEEVQKSFLEAGGDKTSSVYRKHEKDIQKAKSALESLEKTKSLQEQKEDTHWNQLRVEADEYAKSLKELHDQGKFFGDEDYDKVYLAWKNATDAIKAYQTELNKQTESGQAKIAEQEAKAAEKKEAAQRRVEEQAEKALQKENVRIQKQAENEAKLAAKEAERQAKLQAEEAEEERLAQIRANAVVNNGQIVQTLEQIKQLEQEIADLKKAGVTDGYKDYDDRIQTLSQLRQEVKDYNTNVGEVKESYKKLGNTAKQTFDKINKSSQKSGGLLGTIATRFKGLALSMLIFNQISKAFRALAQGIKEGFENFYNVDEGFKNSVDSLKVSLLTLKNSLAAAFAPLVQTVIPYIQKAVEWLTKLIDKVGQFIAAVSGQRTYTKAVKQTTSALKGQNKEQNRQLSSLDKLNNLTSDKAGGKEDNGAADMFKEVPIDEDILDFLQKIKDFLKPIIDYAKKLKDVFMQGFWDGLGDWQYRWESIKDSLKSIKDSLIDIWTDPAVLAAADGWAQSVAYMLGSLVGSLASIGLTIATNLLGGIAKYFEQNKDRIKQYLISMFNIWAEVNMLFAELFQSVAYVFEAFASESGQQLTANIIGIFVNAFMGITELASKLFRDIANLIIQPIVDNKEGLRTALEGFLGVLAEVTGTIKQGIDDTFDKLNEVYDAHFKPFFDSVAQGLSDLVGQFLEFWNGNVQPILDQWAADFDELWQSHIQPLLDNAAEFLGKIADLLMVVWENYLQPMIAWIIANVLPKVLPVLQAIWDTLKNLVGYIADAISNVITILGGLIDFITGVFSGDWEKAFGGLQDAVGGFIDLIKNIIEGGLQFIADIFKTIFEAIKAIVDSAWEGIKSLVTAGINFVKQNIIGKFNEIKAAFSAFKSNVSQIWTNMWNGLKEKVSNIMSSIKNTVKSAVDWISQKIKAIGDAWNRFAQWNWGGSTSNSGSNRSSSTSRMAASPYAATPAIAALADMPIPGYATGQVIPRSMKQHLAVLGDNSRETEVVSPLSTIEQAVINAMAKVGGVGTGGGSLTVEIPVILNGNEIGRAVQKFDSEFFKQNGRHAFA